MFTIQRIVSSWCKTQVRDQLKNSEAVMPVLTIGLWTCCSDVLTECGVVLETGDEPEGCIMDAWQPSWILHSDD